MDERLRQLERQYRQGFSGKEEILNLRRIYVGNFGFCPAWFVIQQINDYIQEYTTMLYDNHQSTRETVEKLLVDYASIGDPTVAQVLEEERPFWLEISAHVWEKDVNEFPMIIVMVWLRLRFLPIRVGDSTQRPRWEEMRAKASDWLRGMIASQLEQCGYEACVNEEPAQIHKDDTTIITGVGYPLKHIGPSPFAAEFAEMYRIWPQSRSPYEAFDVIMSVPIDTINLKGQKDYIAAPPHSDLEEPDHVLRVVPGSLRRWLLSGDPGGTIRGSIYYGHLMLARVPVQMFLTWSTNSGSAHHELSAASEADIETLPEMIFFVDTQKKTMYLVPTPTEYFKTCYYLRIVADV